VWNGRKQNKWEMTERANDVVQKKSKLNEKESVKEEVYVVLINDQKYGKEES
jgi:hypothetical protein